MNRRICKETRRTESLKGEHEKGREEREKRVFVYPRVTEHNNACVQLYSLRYLTAKIDQSLLKPSRHFLDSAS